MAQLGTIIPWEELLDDVVLRRFFFYFVGYCLLGNNRSVLTCRLLVAMKVVSDIGAYVDTTRESPSSFCNGLGPLILLPETWVRS